MMTENAASLTEEIYQKLVGGLGDSDWHVFLAKHGKSKGPLYNAFGRFVNEMEPRVRELNEVQAKLNEAGLKLDSMDQAIKQKEGSIAPLEQKQNALNEQNEIREKEIAEKSEIVEHIGQLEKLGFDIGKLSQLQESIKEIGAEQGLSTKQAINKFFTDLKDYDTKVGFELEIKRLKTIANTRTLEAQESQAKADKSLRQNEELNEAIDAVQSLIKHRVNVDQVISWNDIVDKLGGPEDLQDKLQEYKSMSELSDAKKKEKGDCDKTIIALNAQIKTLSEQKAGIEAAISALKVAGIKEIEAMSEATRKQLKDVAATEIGEIKAVSEEARDQFNVRFAQYDELQEGIVQAVQKLERLKQESQKYKAIKNILEAQTGE